jgi:hypothetical protein
MPHLGRRFPLFAPVILVALAGCSGAGSAPLASGASQAQARAFVAPLRSGVIRQPKPPQAQTARNVRTAKIERDLFVSDGSGSVAVLANRSHKNVGQITDGLNGADGVWVDNAGNLYVANYKSAQVTEYTPGSSTPKCTYSSGLVDPITVTTDRSGNVYVADFNDYQDPGYLYKYAQCSNTVTKRYTVILGPTGVAVDRRGNIFVMAWAEGYGYLLEFKRGRSTPTALGATVNVPGGLVIDNKGNLIADDQEVATYQPGSIDIIAPPYYQTSVPLIQGLGDPYHVALNKQQTRLFSANVNAGTVTVYSYPAGALLETLGPAQGLTTPYGVSDSPNAVF